MTAPLKALTTRYSTSSRTKCACGGNTTPTSSAFKRLQVAIRERRTAQNHITEKVLDFMKRHNIEDLNTKEGVLRYRTAVVKAPLSQKSIKTRLSEFFERDPNAMNYIKKIFEDREKVEKVSLRRLKL